MTETRSNTYTKPMLNVLLKGLGFGDELLQANTCTHLNVRDMLASRSFNERERLFDNLVSHRWNNDELYAIEETLFCVMRGWIPGSDKAWSLSHSHRLAEAAPSLVGLLPQTHLHSTLPIALSVDVSALEFVSQGTWHLVEESHLVSTPGSLLREMERLSDKPWRQSVLTPAVMDRLTREFEADPQQGHLGTLLKCALLARIDEAQLVEITRAAFKVTPSFENWRDLLGVLGMLELENQRLLVKELPYETFSTWVTHQIFSLDPSVQALLYSKGAHTPDTLRITSSEALRGVTNGLAADAFRKPPAAIVRFSVKTLDDLAALLEARGLYLAHKDYEDGWPYQTPVAPGLKQSLFDSPELVETMVRDHGLSDLAPDYLVFNDAFRAPILRGLGARGRDIDSVNQFLFALDRHGLIPQDGNLSNFELWADVLGPYLAEDIDGTQMQLMEELPATKKEALLRTYRAALLTERAARSTEAAPAAAKRALGL